MKQASYISKLKPDPEGLDFNGLREEGLRLVQKLSGDVWTDYNLHDPGVTILEALCYALTDLIYRAGFDAADYLVSDSGEIEFGRLGLFRPDQILPCHPLTDDDYRKLILDAMPAADNVWIERGTDKPGAPPGLCHVHVLLGDHVGDQCSEDARRKYADQVEGVYASHRNLCEDLGGVEFVERLPYALAGEIETDGTREPASVLGHIQFECARYLTPKLRFRAYPDMQAEGASLVTLLSGVLTGNGYIADEELHEWRGQFSIAELVGRLKGIDGVRNIGRLHFVDEEGRHLDYIDLGSARARKAVACLQRHSTQGGIRLHKSGQTYLIREQDVDLEYAKLDYASRALRNQASSFDWVAEMLPAAVPHNIGEYYSVQNHFPAAYGINAYGVPESYPPARKAQAMQLKAYLLMFEQVMANFLQNASEIRRLFSLDEDLTQSYFSRVLSNAQAPKAEELYRGNYQQMQATMSRIVAQFDDFGDRRSRVLDHLLGLYGEKFNQNSLRHFFAEGAGIENALIRNKLAFLKDIVSISRDRAAAFDYRRPISENNGTILEKKLKLLLGLNNDETPPSARMLGGISQARDGIHVVEHILLRPVATAAHDGIAVPADFYGFRASIIFHAPGDHPASADFRTLAEQTVYLNCPAHILPEVYWLDAEPMRQFNMLLERWLTAKQAGSSNTQLIDAAAGRLIAFLLRNRKDGNG